MKMAGYLYVMSNSTMPGLLRIGATTGLPDHHAEELLNRSVPAPFVIEFAIWHENVHEITEDVHLYLGHCRVVTSRCFFQVSLREAIHAIVCCHQVFFHCNWRLVDAAQERTETPYDFSE